MGDFEEGLRNAEMALKIDVSYRESQLVKARCLYGLARFREAADALIRAKADPSECTRALTAVQQSENGKFKWTELVTQTTQNPAVKLECATFQSPKMTLKEVSGKGRGFFAESDIARGTLLLVEPALAVSGGRPLLDQLMSRVGKSVFVKNSLVELSVGGKDLPIESVAEAVVKTCAWDMYPCLEAIGAGEDVPESGIFFRGSLFNHSCEPNCRPSFLGDAIIVVAMSDVPASEELTFTYVPPDATVGERRKMLLENYGFECDCARCKKEAPLTDKLAELSSSHYKLHGQFSRGVAVHSLDETKRVISLCKTVEKESVSAILHRLKSMCAMSAEQHGDLDLAIKTWKEVIECHSEDTSVGRTSAHSTATECFKLATLCMVAGRRSEAAEWNARGYKWLTFIMPEELAKLSADAMISYFMS